MKERITSYMRKVDNDIKNYEAYRNLTQKQYEEAIQEHLVQISFFQHERFIHLIVMVLFAIITIACVLYTVVYFNIIILILTLLSFILLVPYVAHYYLLENNVQRMYTQYDKMLELKKSAKK